MKKIISFVGILGGILIAAVLWEAPVRAAEASPACADVEVIFARGSGQSLGDRESTQFQDQMRDRIKSPLKMNFYELGTAKHGDGQYPAVNVGDWTNGNALGGWLSAGYANDYGESVKQGRSELIYYFVNRFRDCKDSQFVLAGYSQGAQVVGQALVGLEGDASRIAYVGLFGDPKLHLPEGEGWNPPACRGEQMSAYRRVIANCHVDNGSLGARKPYLPQVFHAKTGLWCYADDFVCGSSKNVFNNAGHEIYGKSGNAIDSAAWEAALRLKPLVAPDKQHGISVTPPKGTGTTGVDMVFVIDTTGSMAGQIEQSKQFALQAAERIKSMRGRVALVSYRDAGDSYTARIESHLNEDMTEFRQKLAALRAEGGGDTPEATLHALMTAFNGLRWKNGATKASIVLTDAGFHHPDKVDGSTVDGVAKRSLEIDPVNIYPVVPSYIAHEYEELASLTSGQVIVNGGDTEAALFEAIDRIERRPTALLKNPLYIADAGQSITYDASDSYVEEGEITRYDWDFDGDGSYEVSTSTPVTSHVYSEQFDGAMQVRLTASNGTIASASALVKIGTYVAPPAPKAPVLRVLKDNGSSAIIAWQPTDNLASEWVVGVNGTVLGRAPKATVVLTIDDLQRSDDLTINVAGMMSDGTVGEFASVTVAKKIATPGVCTGNPWGALPWQFGQPGQPWCNGLLWR